MKKMIYWAFVAPLIVACSNNDMIEEMAETTPVLDSRAASRVEWGDSTDVLHFNNEADFEKAVADLALLDESDDKYALVSSTYGDVTSLKSVYDQAMQDAADLDESKAAYLNYKNKYGSTDIVRG